MSFTFPIVAATVMAACAAFLQMLQPETWAPFYRAELAAKSSRFHTLVGMYIGVVGQAATTAAVGLLMTILILSVVAVADEQTPLWSGAAVCALSLVFFIRQWRSPDSRWTNAAGLIEAMRPKSGKADPYGPFEQSPGEVIGSTIFSPRFILAPMFVAAAGSGTVSIGNAVPVIIAYALFSVGGMCWLVRQVHRTASNSALRLLVTRSNLFIGVGVFLLGIVVAVW